MYKYIIVIMDYTFGSLRFYHFDNKPEDPEEWIRTHDEAWSDSTCYWMGVEGDIVNEDHTYSADKLQEVDNE